MLTDRKLTIRTLLNVFRWRVGVTWGLILSEMALTVLIPLYMGFAIDGLLEGIVEPFVHLGALMAFLTVIGVARRIYDTRVYGTIRVELGNTLASRFSNLPVSTLNARIGMGRELADFLEDVLPNAMASVLQFVVSAVLLFYFSPMLAVSACAVLLGMISVYALFQASFWRWNRELNQQMEHQVCTLEKRKHRPVLVHLKRLRKYEVKLSDTEAILYGTIFILLIGLVLFNLWFATQNLDATPGAIFSIVSYTWEFAEAALALPITLQSWSRLSEITTRLQSG
ncbi:ABC transporter transmembrane region [Ruegeria halocynthiae]|uniref:ABC transporter transmembrane region n=1 Tax=Ruegeria halocynthiae TaxID=985054 RepID=A0A1H3FVR5_9RHOB|nr:ABC transporter six-transmembrane domain-containing protein [Ruegeria halocynthiae]SDX95061.1 ABC transporter transmembrane region [Ruegeria halocynthiae]